MYTTQQRVTRSPLSITPRTDGQKFGNPIRHVSGKGKAVAFIDGPPPPPLGFLNENEVSAAADGGELDDWMRFKEAGLLDEATMERKDREALAEKAARLEKELFDYQYNMGLLLIENKELITNTEELKEALAETQEVLKREEAAHFMAVSEVEKRMDNLKKALDYEKRCRADLEKALREIDEENKQIKLRSQAKLADAHNIVAGIGDKYKEVEEKMHQADLKLAEVDRKFLDLDKRMQELETRESLLQSERQSFIAVREAWENTYSKHKEDLREWEKKLQEGEERLCEGRRVINLREEKVNEIEKAIKQKEKELEETHNKIDLSNLESKKKEDAINDRLLNLIAKEEQAEEIRKNLEIKEKELLDLTEKLTAKEKMEIQKLLEAHKEALDSKRREFDLEMDGKRKSIEADMRSKVEAVEQKIGEINHKEEKLRKLEQSLEKKSARFNEKEKEIDLKSKALKENEKINKAEAKKLETDKKQLLAEQESLQVLKMSIEKFRDEITQKELQVNEEIEKLKITEDERTNYSRLQLELKDEIEKCRIQKELIMKEIDDLKNDRLKFEQEWEVLDEKRSKINKELREFDEQKENFEKHLKVEEEKLEKEKISTKDYIKQQLEAVNLEKETFEAKMKHEESLLVEKYENEQRQFLHDFEKRKRDFEVNLQNKRMEMEKNMEKKEREFEELKEKELGNINYLKEVVRKNLEEVESERSRIDKEKNEIVLNNQKLAENQLELRKDIDALGDLNKKIKEQRGDFVKERNRFIEFVEKLKNCGNCVELVRKYELSDMQIPEVRDDDSPNSRIVNENNGKSEGIIANKLKSWINSTVFKLSPHRKTEHQHDEIPETPLPETVTDLAGKIDDSNVPAGMESDNIAQKEQLQVANDSHDDNQSYLGSKNLEVPEGSQQSEMKSGRNKPVRKTKGGARINPNVDPVAEDGFVNEKRGGPTTRKRAHAETSLASGSEMGDGGESEVHSESVTTGGDGGRRKRRQTVAPPPQTPGESRYNLRRIKTGDVASHQAKASNNNIKRKEVSSSRTKEETQNEIATDVDKEVGSDDVNKPVHVTISKKTDTLILDTAFKTSGDIVGSSGDIKFVKNTEIIEEFNVTHESENLQNNDDDDVNDDDDHDDEDEDDDGDEQHPGEVSIGKKIWKFLST